MGGPAELCSAGGEGASPLLGTRRPFLGLKQALAVEATTRVALPARPLLERGRRRAPSGRMGERIPERVERAFVSAERALVGARKLRSRRGAPGRGGRVGPP